MQIGCFKTGEAISVNYNSTAATIKNSNAKNISLEENQPQTSFEMPTVGKKMPDFKPEGWVLMSFHEGDLNGDGLPDGVAVFSQTANYDEKGSYIEPSQMKDKGQSPRYLYFQRS